MDPIKRFRRCVFCRGKNEKLKYIRRHGLYGDSCLTWAYHESCLNDVSCSPEDYSREKVDMAIEITDLKARHARLEAEVEKEHQKKCKYLKEMCVE